jgi:muconolactone delta-isomerase
MKFLVIVTPRRDAPIPPAGVAQILGAQREWIRQRREEGTLETAYSFLAGGGIGIFDVDSHEALNEALLGSPGFAISDYDVRALVDVDTALGNGVAAMERIAGAIPQPG